MKLKKISLGVNHRHIRIMIRDTVNTRVVDDIQRVIYITFVEVYPNMMKEHDEIKKNKD